MSKRLEEVMRLVNGAGKQDQQEEVRVEAASSAAASERMQEIRKYTSRLPAAYAKARFDGAIKKQQEQPKKTEQGFTWNVPADAGIRKERFQAVSPTEFQQNDALMRKYGGNYDNYLNDNRRSFDSTAEYQETVARAKDYNSKLQLQGAKNDLSQLQQEEERLLRAGEELQRNREAIDTLYEKYEQTGDQVDAMTYLAAAEQFQTNWKQYQEQVKQHEKAMQSAGKAYKSAFQTALRNEESYMKAADRLNQEVQARVQEQSRRGDSFGGGGFGKNQPGNLPEGRGEGLWASGPVEFLDKTFTATRAGQMDWMAGMATLDRKAGNAMLRLGASMLADISKLTGNQKLKETADAWWKKSYSVSQDAMDAQKASQEFMKQALSGTGVVDGWIVQQMESVGSMAMDIFAAGTTGAMNLPEGASSLQIMGTRAAGSAMLEAQQKGYSELEQILVGVAAGSLEVISEKLFGGNPLYDTDKGLVNRMVEAVTDNPAVLRLLYSKGFDIFGEGLEEVFTEVLNPIAEGLIANRGDIDWASNEDIVQAFLGGVFLSLMGQGAEVVVRNVSGEASAQRKAEREYGKWIQNADAVQELVDEGLAADRMTDAYWQAVRMQEKLDAGRTVSLREIGRQLIANQEAIETGKLVNREVETPADAPEGALHDADAGFYAIRTEKASDGSTNYQVVEVSEAGTITERTRSTPSLFEAKLSAEIEGMNIRHIGTNEALLAAVQGKTVEAEVEAADNGAGTTSERKQENGLEWAGSQMEESISGQNEVEQKNAEPDGIQWAGNTKKTETEVMNNERAETGTVDRDGDGGRDVWNAAGNGEKNPRREAAHALGRRAEEARRVQANVQAVGGELTSLRELGLKGGSEEKNVRIVSREAWTSDVEEAWEIADSEGLEFVPVSGQLWATAENGNEIKFVAAIQNGTVYAQADSMKQSIREAILHEVFHEKVQKDPGLRDRVIRKIKQTYSKEETQAMFERYYQLYQKAHEGTMTDEELEFVVWEEMLADAYAEFQRYSDTFGPVSWAQDVQDEVWRKPENREGDRRDNAQEDGRYSIDGTTEGETYSYEALIAKPPVKIVEVQERDIPTQGKKVSMLEIAQEGRKKASVLYNDLQGAQRYVYVKDLDANVLVPVKGFTHGLTGNKTSGSTMRTAEVTYDLVEILRNSVAVNEMDKRSEKDGDWSYILFGYARKADGQEYIVKSTVNHFGINKSVVDSVEIYDVLKGAKAKKVETEVIGSHTGTSPAARLLNASVSTEISVADLLEAVKENYPELLPDSVREYFGIQGTKKEPGTRFSLSSPVEQTETLIALHNMTEEKLKRTLELGSWPSPSIAIVRAEQGHENFGEYSAVFPRSTIDPEADNRNKVYGSDAWTPTHNNAQVEYEVNYDAKRAFENKIYDLSSKFAGGAFQNSSVIGGTGVGNETNMSLDEIAQRLAKYPAVQAAYLQDRGDTLEPVYKAKNFDSFGNEALQRYIDSIGYQELARLDMELTLGNELPTEIMEAARDIIMDEWVAKNEWRLKNKPELRYKRIENQRKKLEDWRVQRFIQHAWEYYEEYGATTEEIDTSATATAMFDMILPNGTWDEVEKVVQDWVRPQLEGVLGEPGIYNGTDRITDNGRRSFRETHYPYSAESIVRAMFEQGEERGGDIWNISSTGLVATATPEYRSVENIHSDEARLQTIDEGEYKQLMQDLDLELERVTDDIMRTTKRQFGSDYDEEQNIGRTILQAAKGKRTTAAIKQSFRKEGYVITDKQAREVLTMLEHASSVPTGYFEAKPQRVVGFEEAVAVLAPNDAPVGLIDQMREAGMNVVIYQAGDEKSRLDSINRLDGIRFSIDKDEIQLKAGRELAQGPHVVPRTVIENSEHIFRPEGMSDEEYADLDAKWQDRKRRTEERPESALDWVIPKTNFRSTPAMEKLGIRVDGSVTRYRETAQLRAYEKAANEAKRILRKRVKALRATDQEQRLANDIAEGVITPDALNGDRIDIDIVTELADYIMAARAFNEDMIARRRSEINGTNYQIADELFRDSEAYNPKLAFIPNITKLVMNERTPERVVKQIFGTEQGGKIYETYFRPVWVNGAEMYRFENRMLQRVEKFEDQNGVKRKLTEKEREFAQKLMEGEAVRENLRRLDEDTRERVVAVAQNVNNGMEFLDAVREQGLTDEYHMGLAQAYADYLDTETMSKDMDRTILANAIREYQAIYNDLYEAINDFLVSHGYQEIGFIKGYAPHFQKRDVQQGLFGALKSLGVEKESVSELPASIAGRTADFKPNMKWNPHMQTRQGTKTDYDIQAGFEQYLHYVAEMFYHTDDVMRVRQAVNWFRGQYSGDEIRLAIEDAEVDRYKSAEWKKEFLKEKGILGTGVNTDARTVETMYAEYVSKLFDRAKPENLQKYSEFVTWMDNYANIVAGKQSMADRGIEYGGGRTALNMGSRMMRRFSEVNVAGNISSVLNQSAQLPLIQQQLGTYMERAMFDMARGGLKKDNFADRSDFLTDKRGVEKLTMDNYEKVISAMFKPAEMMDRLVSTIAVRGRYLQALNEGMDIDQAMKEADDFGRRVMGSRMKGAKPLAFESKTFTNQMLHVFQVEASNTFDYMFLSDMPQAVKQVEKTKGKAAATRYTAAAVVGYLLNAFLLNRLTDWIYGGTPAPFDLMGWALEFVAGGWGRSDEEYLKTLIDNGWERLFQERPFDTERIDKSEGLDWAGSIKNLGYNVLNDIPYARNAAGVMGLGDQSLPTVGINEFGKNLWSAGATLWNQATKGEEETGLDWAGAAMSAGEDVGNAAVMLMPGGRQVKKTAQGIAAMIRGGAYSGYGENQRLKYPVDQSIWNGIRAGLFGLNALGETDAYYAGEKSLTAEQTKRVQELEDLGIDRFTSYGLYQDFREINQKLTGAEAKTAKREAIDSLPLEDEQKLELYMKTMVGDKGNAETTRQKYQELLDEGVSWHQLTQLDNAISLLNQDEDDDGEPDLSALERGIAKRNEIAAMDLNDWKKLEVFDRYVLDRNGKNYEKIRQEYEAMLDAGLSWEDVTRAHNTYAELEADEELNATQKATEYAKWADEQNWDADQKKAIKERYKFWQMIPAEATSYEKFTDAGLSSESSDLVTKLLASLELEAGKDTVSINQKVLAIDGSSLSKGEKVTAIAAMKPERMEKLSEAGVSNSTAEKITAEIALEEAKNGDDNLSTIRKARISVDAAKNNDEAMEALSVIVGKETYPKIQMAAEFGVNAENWVEFKERWADWYGDDSVSQEKVENVLDDMYLTMEQKAALWQIANRSWKPKNNPYSREVGQEIYEALNEE